MERVLDVRRRVRRAEQSPRIRLVVGEQQLRRAVDRQPVIPQPQVRGNQRRASGPPLLDRDRRDDRLARPRPRIAEPQRRQHVERCRVRSAVRGRDPDGDVVDVRLGVFDDDVEEAVLVEGAGVGQLELADGPVPATVLVDQLGIRKRALWVAIERLEVRPGRRRVEVGIHLLDVLAVIALRPGQPEQAFLEDGVLAVPQGDGEVEPAVLVADPEQSVLAPAVRARTGLVVRQVTPGVAVSRIVLADRAPLAVGQVGTPAPPRRAPIPGVGEPLPLRIERARATVVAQPKPLRVERAVHRAAPADGAAISTWALIVCSSSSARRTAPGSARPLTVVVSSRSSQPG